MDDQGERAGEHRSGSSGAADAPPVEQLSGYRTLDAMAADRVLALIRTGPKRAFAHSMADIRPEHGPFPEPGQRWGVKDSHGELALVFQVDSVRIGPLYSVDASFAWEHGEGDRTRSGWISTQERALLDAGVDDFEGETMVFERFSRQWPNPDEPLWWAAGVRELRGPEPLPHHPRPDLPTLACVNDLGDVVGLLRFEPDPGDLRLVWVDGETLEIVQRLRDAFENRRAADRGVR